MFVYFQFDFVVLPKSAYKFIENLIFIEYFILRFACINEIHKNRYPTNTNESTVYNLFSYRKVEAAFKVITVPFKNFTSVNVNDAGNKTFAAITSLTKEFLQTPNFDSFEIVDADAKSTLNKLHAGTVN